MPEARVAAMKAVYISGFCNSEAMARDGRISTNTDPDQFHRLCRTEQCTCPHHSDVEAECKFCGYLVTGSDRCSDIAGCQMRLEKRLAGSARAEELKAQRLAAKSQASTQKRESRLKGSGRCEHCGEPTAGGRFRMGHDAKLKGDLFRLVRDKRKNAVSALAELMLRGWVPKDLDESGAEKPSKQWQAAELAAKEPEFLNRRIEGRIGGER